MDNHLEGIKDALGIFVKYGSPMPQSSYNDSLLMRLVGVSTIRTSQKHTQRGLQNLSIVVGIPRPKPSTRPEFMPTYRRPYSRSLPRVPFRCVFASPSWAADGELTRPHSLQSRRGTITITYSCTHRNLIMLHFSARMTTLDRLVNCLWISSLVFSIASAINSQLAYHCKWPDHLL